ncbi:MAG TPA: phosphohistidine phosphatase SixA [Methanocella sp.]|uniref:phosphohistidine phosphatase SixA n=1 Tax=Methanocella sp. TaxID=2052833 RepID=UPI002CF92D7F|nr:phosphohistidine phosphatase SixA [Methanocella sp.]HTY92142.1 phosphohistidine phosphatase SixA [Methanocella sp.]
MLELYIIRHGLAGKPLEDVNLDEERPLTKKGKERMKAIAKGLDEMGIAFDVVVSSPLTRSKETAEIVDKYCSDADIVYTDLLKPGATYDPLIDYLNGLTDKEKVAIVGHEPFLSGFVSYCLAKSKNSFIKLKKGGILALEMEGALKPGQCKLAWLMEPWQLEELA